MELIEIGQFLKKKWKSIAGSILVGILLGGSANYWYPLETKTSGTFLIGRKLQPENGVDSRYSGYYNQRTAKGYAYTLGVLLQSRDTFAQLAELLNEPKNAEIIARLRRHTKIRVEDQILQIETTGKNEAESKRHWEKLKEITQKYAKEIKSEEDPHISVKFIEQSGWTRKQYIQPLLGAIGGASLIGGSSIFILALREFTKKSIEDTKDE